MRRNRFLFQPVTLAGSGSAVLITLQGSSSKFGADEGPWRASPSGVEVCFTLLNIERYHKYFFLGG